MKNSEGLIIMIFINWDFLVGFDGVYDNEEDTQTTTTTTTTNNQNQDDNDPFKKLKFTPEQQEFINKRMQQEKQAEQKKAKEQNDKTINELKKIQEQAGTSEQQKQDLQKRIKELETQYVSKEELAKQEQEKKEKEYRDALNTQKNESDRWKKAFHDSTITREIQDAAISAEAYSPLQMVDMLFNKTNLVEEVDSDNKTTGHFVARVKFTDTDEQGKPMTLDLTVTELLKKMKNTPDKYGNLFKSGVVGGLGQNGSVNNGTGGAKKKAARMNTEEYLKAREKDKNLNFTQK